MDTKMTGSREEIMPPPWLAYPDIERYSFGCRMGCGEAYMERFYDWLAALSPGQRAAYQAQFPEPVVWKGWWEQTDTSEFLPCGASRKISRFVMRTGAVQLEQKPEAFGREAAGMPKESSAMQKGSPFERRPFLCILFSRKVTGLGSKRRMAKRPLSLSCMRRGKGGAAED